MHPPFDFSQSSFNLLPASRAPPSSRLHREGLCRGIPSAGLRELPGRSAGPRVTFTACEIAGTNGASYVEPAFGGLFPCIVEVKVSQGLRRAVLQEEVCVLRSW